MTDNRTTELLPCLFCGGEARLISSAPDWYFPACMNRECACDWTDSYPTKAEAIHAWNTRATHGTLTAEQVREAVMSADRWEKPMGNTWLTNTHLIIRDDGWQAIADELNAELGSGTCEPNWVLQGKTQTQEFWRCECGNCGHEFGVETRESFPLKMTIGKVDVPNYCPNCGKRVSA